MSTHKQKLELTWIGKNNPEYDIANIEPRILEERTDLSYGDKDTDNMIIHGDNLLALKALLPEYEGKVKCIYIDPPYNTGNAFEHYDDSVEHSTWLSLMKPRLELLKMLLADDGVIFVQIDDNEMAYLKILMDEVFGRDCFLNSVAVKMSTAAGLKMSHKNKKLIKIKETILIFVKNKDTFELSSLEELYSDKPVYETERSDKYIVNFQDKFSQWNLISLHQAFKQFGEEGQEKKDFVNKNYFRIFNHVVNASTKKIWERLSAEEKVKYQDKVREYDSEKSDYDYAFNDHVLIPYNPKILEGDMWNDNYSIGGTKTHEGGVEFNNGKKREILIKRIISISSNINDFVLDSFLGSGTTAAVAHKMGRKYIGIEMGEHAYTHCKVRLDKVVDGTDQGGISKAVEWKGGGGYKFYELAPSFVVIDEFGNPVIDSYYNDTKLIRAMCKLTNYTFAPNPTDYWKQGKGQGNNSIYVTTQILSVAMVQQIVSHLGTNETLLICPKKFEPGCKEVDARITIKKIPQSILKACQFGKKEYLLPIKQSTMEEVDEDENNEEHDSDGN